jgi:hypothetical protein
MKQLAKSKRLTGRCPLEKMIRAFAIIGEEAWEVPMPLCFGGKTAAF